MNQAINPVRIVLCSLFLLLGWQSHVRAAGPSKVDSLRTEIKAAQADSQKVLLSLDLLKELLSGDQEVVLAECEKVLVPALRWGDGAALAKIYYYKGYALQGIGQYLPAYVAFNTAGRWFREVNNGKMVVNCKVQLAECLRLRGDNAHSFQETMSALEYADSLGNPSAIALVENNLAGYYARKGDFPNAKEYFECALRTHVWAGDSSDVANVSCNLGNIYLKMGLYDQAITYYMRAMRLDEEADNQQGLALDYLNLSTLNHLIGDTVRSNEFWIKGLTLAKEIKLMHAVIKFYSQKAAWNRTAGNYQAAFEMDKMVIGICEKENYRSNAYAGSLMGVGSYYLEHNEIDSSLHYLRLAEKIFISSGWDSDLPYINLKMGLCYRKLNQLDLAQTYLEKGMKAASRQQLSRVDMEVHLVLGAIYKEKGLYKLALEQVEIAETIEDSIFNAENQKGIAEIQAQYDTERQKRLVAEERGRTAEARAATAIAERRIYWVAGWSLLALTLALSGLVVLRMRSKARIKEKEQEAALVAERLQTARQRNQSLEALAQQQALEVGKRVKLVQELKTELETLRQSSDPSAAAEFLHLFKVIEQNLQSEEDWNAFKQNFEQIHPQFFAQLVKGFPDISQAELRLCALIRLGLSQKEIAQMVNITPDSVKRSRNRLRHKLKLEEEQDLKEFLLQF